MSAKGKQYQLALSPSEYHRAKYTRSKMYKVVLTSNMCHVMSM